MKGDSVFAILGEITVEVIGSPEELTSFRRYEYAEHRVIEDRPRLQWIADALETLRVQLLLHRSIGSPAASLVLLQQAASSHAALPLVFGNGEFRGYFVITEMQTLSRQLTGAGDPLAITVRVTLREWVSEFDSASALIASFSPVGIASVGATTARVGAVVDAGISALLGLAPATGPATPGLEPNDVAPAIIVRRG